MIFSIKKTAFKRKRLSRTERGGFEPPVSRSLQQISSLSDSTTLASFQLYPRGLEPPTFGSANQCSIQLSYRYIKHGKGGIRTPGTLEGYNSLAGRPIRPLSHLSISEKRGFEPRDACASTVFKTVSLNHSDISPYFPFIITRNKRMSSGIKTMSFTN